MPSPQYQPDQPAFQSPTLPDPAANAPQIAPIQQPALPTPTQAPRYGFGGGGIGAAGKAAFLLDAGLRGFMQGKAQAQAKKLEQITRIGQGRQANYKSAAEALFNLQKSRAAEGKPIDDPNDKDLQAAQVARDSAWQAYVEFQDKFGPDGKPTKGKGKKKDQSQPQPQPQPQPGGAAGAGAGPAGPQAQLQGLLNDMNSPDPNVKHAAASALRKYLGPPDNYQIKALFSPEAQANAKFSTTRAQNEAAIEQKKSRLHELQAKTAKGEVLGENEQQEMKSLEKDREIFPQSTAAAAQASHIIPSSRSMFTLTKEAVASPSMAQFKDAKGGIVDSYGVPIKEGERVAMAQRNDGSLVLLPEEGMDRLIRGMDTGGDEPSIGVYRSGSAEAPNVVATQAVPTSSTHEYVGVNPETGEPVKGSLTTTRHYGDGKTHPTISSTPPSSAQATSTPETGATPTHPHAATQPALPSRPSAKTLAIPMAQYNQMNKQATPIINAGTQILGDPNHPDVSSLVDSVKLYDDPQHREKIGTAVSLILDDLDKEDKGSGTISRALEAGANLDAYAKNAMTKETDQYLSGLDDEERTAVDQLIASAGAIIGTRAATGGSAAKFSAELIERELPIPGKTVASSKDGYLKLAKLAQEIANTSKRNPIAHGYYDYYQGKVKELNDLAGGGHEGKKESSSSSSPSGASDEVYDKDGKTLIGHVIDGKYVPLKKQ